MSNDGPSAYGLEQQGFRNLKSVHWNLTAPQLYEIAVARREGHVAKNGPLVVLTGQHTGRSASDKFVVRDAASENQVWWDNNKPMTPAHFDALYASMMSYAQGRELFAKDLFGGADLSHRLPVRIVTEYAWHSLFVHQLLIRPTAEQLKGFDPEFTIIDLPGFEADPEDAWLRHRHGDRGQLHQEDGPDRRHLLCRRDEEIRLHDPELSAAAQARDADALLGQCRQGRQSPRSSSASRAPARRRCPPTRRAP